jgi:hypothetical protein
VRSGELDGDQTTQGKTQVYRGSAPLLGNDLRPACLTLLLGVYIGVVIVVA